MIYINRSNKEIVTIPRGSAPYVIPYKLGPSDIDINSPGTYIVYPLRGFEGLSSVDVRASYDFNYPSKSADITSKGTHTIEGPMSSLTVNTEVPPTLQEVKIDLRGDTIIEPGEGFDGISSITISTPSTNLQDIDGMKYTGSTIANFPDSMVFAKRTGNNPMGMFQDCGLLRFIKQPFYIKDCNSAENMFAHDTQLTEITIDGFPPLINAMFSSCGRLTTINFIGAAEKTDIKNIENAFYSFTGSKELWVEILKRMNLEYVNSFRYAFFNCAGLQRVSKGDLGDTLYLGKSSKGVSYENAFNFSRGGSLTTDDWCFELWNGANFNRTFSSTDIKNTNFWHSSNKPISFKNTFYSCAYLKEVVSIDLTDCSDASGAFTGCVSLETLQGFPGLKVNMDLSSSPKLTHESLMNVINNLAASNATLTLGETNLAKLTDSEKKIATDKGWTLK